MDWKDRIETVLDAGEVKRCHVLQTLGSHAVASHTWGAMVIAEELCWQNGAETVAVLTWLLHHDVPEIEVGDIPAPTKRANSAIKAATDRLEDEFYLEHRIARPVLPPLEAAIAKASDNLDLGFAMLRERRLGNRHPRIEKTYRNICGYLDDQMHVTGVGELRARLMADWDEAT